MKYFSWLLIIICCSIPFLVIRCTPNEDYTSYTCNSRVLSSIPEPKDLGIYNTRVIDYIEIGEATASVDVFGAVRDGLKQQLLTVGIDPSSIERAEKINALPNICITDDDGYISIDIFCALKSGTSPSSLEEIGVRGNSLAWAQAVDSVAPYSTADSETGEIIVDITDALLKGIPPAVLVTVGFTQAEVDKAQAINQIYQYGTVDPETGDLIFTKSQISKALDEGVTQSAFLAAGIPEDAVDMS